MFCRACDAEKLPSDFYVGVASRCKDCHKAAMKVRALTNPRVQEYDRERAKTPERKQRARQVTIRWRTEHPDAYKAHTAVSNAVRDGKLKKQPCSICGTEKGVHGHHKDYAKPLDVIWLCAKCHHRVHATFPELGGHFQAAE
jgi:hypothetical protein